MVLDNSSLISLSLSLSFQNPSSSPKLATNHIHFRSVSKGLVDLLNGPRSIENTEPREP
ncbi:unnamed protein product [Camellia sinensis]